MLIFFFSLIKHLDKKSYYSTLQEEYDDKIYNLNMFILFCPKCMISKEIIKYGFYYKAFFTLYNTKEEFKTQRIMCHDCGRSSSIFPDDFIPYCPIPVHVIIEILIYILENSKDKHIEENNPILSSDIFYDYEPLILRKYNKWFKERLNSLQIDIYDDDLVFKFVSEFNLQFMQINKLGKGSFILPT